MKVSLKESIFSFNGYNRDLWMAEKAETIPSGSDVLDAGAGTGIYRHLFDHCNYKSQDFCLEPDTQGRYAKMDYVSEAIVSGASGYLTKDNASKELLAAMSKVLKGEEYLDPALSANIINTFKKISAGKEVSGDRSYSLLSPREQEVFRLLAEGHKIVKIAKILKKSRKTIENQRCSIFSKLNFDSLIDLYKYAIRIGIVDPEFS